MNVKKICCLGGEELGVMLSVVIAAKCPEIRVTFVESEERHIFNWCRKVLESNNDVALCNLLRKVKNKNLFFTANKAASIREAEMIFVLTNTELKAYGEGNGSIVDFAPAMNAAQHIVESALTKKIIVECSCLPLFANSALNRFFPEKLGLCALSTPIFFDQKLGLKSVLFPNAVNIGHDGSELSLLPLETLSRVYSHWVDPAKIHVREALPLEIGQIITYALTAQKIANLYTLQKLTKASNYSLAKFSKSMEEEFRSVGLPETSPNIGNYCNGIKTLTYLFEENYLSKLTEFFLSPFNIFATEEFVNLQLLMKSFDPRTTITIYGFNGERILVPELSRKILLFLIEDFFVNIYDPKGLEPVKDFEESFYQRRGRAKVFDDPYKAAENSQIIFIHSYQRVWLSLDFKQIFDVMKKPAHILDPYHMLIESELANIGFQVYDFFPEILKSEIQKC